MDDMTDLIARLNESRAHCGMCGEQAVARNSRDQYICEACLHETIPTPPYRMRWEAADAIEDLQARVAELELALNHILSRINTAYVEIEHSERIARAALKGDDDA